jgi:hypothetical protein
LQEPSAHRHPGIRGETHLYDALPLAPRDLGIDARSTGVTEFGELEFDKYDDFNIRLGGSAKGPLTSANRFRS